ncbi:Feruloyl CoA ortho-hydroxylase 1 [Linum perenne]
MDDQRRLHRRHLRPAEGERIAEQISDASLRLGFFQVINHEILVEALDSFVGVMRGFHELQMEEKSNWSSEEKSK